MIPRKKRKKIKNKKLYKALSNDLTSDDTETEDNKISEDDTHKSSKDSIRKISKDITPKSSKDSTRKISKDITPKSSKERTCKRSKDNKNKIKHKVGKLIHFNKKSKPKIMKSEIPFNSLHEKIGEYIQK